jgi:hypothetical protein
MNLREAAQALISNLRTRQLSMTDDLAIAVSHVEMALAQPEPAQEPVKVWWLPWAPQEVARRFHLAYEQFAPDFGYETRPDTKVFDPNSANGQLMIAVVRNVLIEQASAYLDHPAPAQTPMTLEQIGVAANQPKMIRIREGEPIAMLVRAVEKFHGITGSKG